MGSAHHYLAKILSIFKTIIDSPRRVIGLLSLLTIGVGGQCPPYWLESPIQRTQAEFVKLPGDRMSLIQQYC